MRIPNKVLAAGLVFVCLATLIAGICIGAYGWAVSDKNPEASYSLWRKCEQIAGHERCDDIHNPSGDLNAVRRLLITGVVHAVIGILMYIYFLYKTGGTGESSSKCSISGPAICASVAAILQLICAVLYALSYEDDYGTQYELGNAYNFHNLSIALHVASIICLFVGHKTISNKCRDNPGVVVMTTYPAGHQPTAFGQHPAYGQHPGYGQQGAYPTQQGAYPAAYPSHYPPPSYPGPSSGPPGGQGHPGMKGNPAYPPPPPMYY